MFPGLAKYVNHYEGIAPLPNVCAIEGFDSLGTGMGQGTVVKLFALRTINKGDQLCLDYGPMYHEYDWEAAWEAKQESYATKLGLESYGEAPAKCQREGCHKVCGREKDENTVENIILFL